MKIIGLNGIFSHGEGNIDILLRGLEIAGYETYDMPLKKRGFLSARWGADQDAKEIVEISEPGDVIVAHSYGGVRALKAMEEVDYRYAFLMNPAMSNRTIFPTTTEVFCFHSRDDLAILAGMFMLLHPFGSAGRRGFKDPNVGNIEINGGHNNAFEEWLPQITRFITKIIEEE